MAVSSTGGSSGILRHVLPHLSPAVGKFTDLVVSKGQGAWVWTVDGRKLLDATCGIGATSTGHCHPKVVAAVQKQAANIVHAQQNIFSAHEKMVELVDRMLPIVPKDLSRFVFANSGSEAVENAIKVARARTKRQNIIAFNGGFHGRTFGAMALTSSKTIYRQHFGPLMPGVFFAPYPYCLHCDTRKAAAPAGPYQQQPCCDSPLQALEWMLKMQTHPEETAAMILEPVLGEGGFLLPPPTFIAGLRQLCDKHGIMLILDEVQSGVGRTGKWWGLEHFPGAQPDILVFAKGVASGYPMAGIATKDDAFEGCAPGTLGGTYGGNAVACAAAVATLDAIQEEGMLENATARGQQLMDGLRGLSNRYPILDVRGIGLMVAVEFGGKADSSKPQAGIASAVCKAALKHDMLLITAGPREVIRFLPPLNITAGEVDSLLERLEAACKEVFSS